MERKSIKPTKRVKKVTIQMEMMLMHPKTIVDNNHYKLQQDKKVWIAAVFSPTSSNNEDAVHLSLPLNGSTIVYTKAEAVNGNGTTTFNSTPRALVM